MWKTKFSILDEKGVIAPKAKKIGVDIKGYTLNHYSKKDEIYFTLNGFIEGNEKQIKEYIELLNKDPKVDKLESYGSFFICRIKEKFDKKRKKHIEIYYNPLIIQLRPFLVHSNGWETVEMASFERKHLEKVLQISEKSYKMKLDYLKEEKIDELGILNVFPKLTEQQNNAIKLAMKKGYYEYPRKTSVKEMAKGEKLSFSTFQEHLRKAEKKIIPFAIKSSNV